MKQLGLNEIRESFLQFFESKGHLRLKSAPLIPQNDKSLLLISAGMAPLKPYFTGQEIPPSKRVASCQKCVRTNDIENVGVTSSHCTFFEMLGNFSFGDYFKEEVIPWAWEFLTGVLEIPEERLFPSVYLEDDEAFDIWNKKIGVDKKRIFKFGKEDNFWEIGVGPCGPSSEIYFDRGPEYGCGKPDCAVGCDCNRFVEVWNLVFTQFNKEEDGSYSRLKSVNIDTGMGLERISAAIQGVSSNFDVDTLRAIRDEVCKISGAIYGTSQRNDKSIRIITDHVRAVTFMLSDGILPSNEGRGYVLRRLLRRAARHGKLLGIDGAFLSGISKTAVEISKNAYPELSEKEDYIRRLISTEENRFHETLDQGMEMLKKLIGGLRDKITPEFLGSRAFTLYDTYGFPLELTLEILNDEGIVNFDVNAGIEAFNKEMEKQRLRGRAAREESNYMGAGAGEAVFGSLPSVVATEFVGYEATSCSNAQIAALAADNRLVNEASEDMNIQIITDKTPFYAESGGQAGDCGVIKTASGTAEITDCRKIAGNKTVHYGKVISGTVSVGQKADLAADSSRRAATARNHSATHLLHKALREVLGTHVEQAGSLVSGERLRFDFTHFTALTSEELEKIETLVNEKILEGLPVKTFETDMEGAKKMGAIALFGEKYGDKVRVVDMEGWSTELCGGTHVENTGKIGPFKILSENGVAAGVRRIEALTGFNAIAYYKSLEHRLEDISALAKATPENILAKLEALIKNRSELTRELEKLQNASAGNTVNELYNKREVINSVPVIAAHIDGLDIDAQRAFADKLRDKLASGLVLLASGRDGKNTLLATAGDDAVKAGVNCGNIVKETAKAFGGNGGGRPNMAQAGIPAGTSIKEALEKAKTFI